MNFKKLLVTLLAGALLLTACGKTDETVGGENNTDTTITDTTTEENTGASEPANVITSADDAIAFLDNDVYTQCPPESLPMMLMSMPLELTDSETITYHTGLADVSGITDIIISESGVGSIAYSLVYLRTDGTNTEEIQKTLGESINPRKWVCVGAEYIASVTLDNDVVLIMGAKDQVDMVMDAVTTAAEGKFNNIGSVVTFG